MRRGRSQNGFTMMELVIALVIGLVVVLAIGSLVLQNQRSWAWNKDKTVLQQNVTECLEWMARSTRAARSLEVVSDQKFKTYDENGTLVHTYQRANVAAKYKIREDDHDLVDRVCTRFQVSPDNDTTSITIEIELRDEAGNLVAGSTRAAARNRSYEF